VIVPQPQVRLTADRTVLPEFLRDLIINGILELNEHDARQFPVMKPVIEGFQPIEFLPDRVRDPNCPPTDHLDNVREQSEHVLLPKPSGQLPHGGWVEVGFVGALLRRPIGEEEHGADDFIAPLRPVDQLEL
jgi:hypothetical protein